VILFRGGEQVQRALAVGVGLALGERLVGVVIADLGVPVTRQDFQQTFASVLGDRDSHRGVRFLPRCI